MKYLKLFILLLTVCTGLAACSKNEEIYGIPTVTFSISGHVSDDKGKPIEGISVRFRNDAETYTDAEGNFEFKHCRTFGTGGDTFGEYLLFRDVDGAANGAYENTKAYVTFVRNEDVKTGGGYNGDYRAHDTGIVLREKPTE
ncbi:MAG: radical SAM-associated putative lipoprotein [Alistipes sp.]|nr:radical SAM-associated putative lipoprotein [Alistipes sp.]